MNFELDAEHEQVVQAMKRFAEREMRPASAAADHAATLPSRFMTNANDLGLLSDAVPTEFDGMLDGAYSHTLRSLRGFELGRGCSALAAVAEANVETALCIATWGSADAKRELFASLAANKLATLANDRNRNLTLSKDGNGFRITGKLHPLAGAKAASHLLLIAATDQQPVVLLVTLTGTKIEPAASNSWRAAEWATVLFEHHFVPATHVVAVDDKAKSIAAATLAWCKVSLAARAVGVATAAIEYAEQYGKERIQFGQPIGTFESIIRLREDNLTAIAAARLLTLHAAALCDKAGTSLQSHSQHIATEAASRARQFANDTVTKATIDAVQIFGGYGFVNDYPVEKLMRDARAFDAVLGDERVFRVLDGRA